MLESPASPKGAEGGTELGALGTTFRSTSRPRIAIRGSTLVSRSSPDMRFWIALAVALASDFVDFFGGFLPWLGDIVDGITLAILYPMIGVFALFGVPELLSAIFPPAALLDFLPFFTVGVIAYKILGGKRKR